MLPCNILENCVWKTTVPHLRFCHALGISKMKWMSHYCMLQHLLHAFTAAVVLFFTFLMQSIEKSNKNKSLNGNERTGTSSLVMTAFIAFTLHPTKVHIPLWHCFTSSSISIHKFCVCVFEGVIVFSAFVCVVVWMRSLYCGFAITDSSTANEWMSEWKNEWLNAWM